MDDLKKTVSEALENIQQRPWAEPLGKTLQFSGKIVKELRDFVPGAMIVGGALCFGAAILNPSPSICRSNWERPKKSWMQKAIVKQS